MGDDWSIYAGPGDVEAFAHQAACALLKAEKVVAVRSLEVSAPYQAALEQMLELHRRILGAVVEFAAQAEDDNMGQDRDVVLAGSWRDPDYAADKKGGCAVMSMPSGSRHRDIERNLAALGKAFGYSTRLLVLSAVPELCDLDGTALSLIWLDEDVVRREIGDENSAKRLFSDLRWQDSPVVNQRFIAIWDALREGKAPPPPDYTFV